jgi:hypothetical protein
MVVMRGANWRQQSAELAVLFAGSSDAGRCAPCRSSFGRIRFKCHRLPWFMVTKKTVTNVGITSISKISIWFHELTEFH